MSSTAMADQIGNDHPDGVDQGLVNYYKINETGRGQWKTIDMEQDLHDWDSSMLIAQGVANDDRRAYRDAQNSEIPVDLYALYAAYDSSNLYLMWEMVNPTDAVTPWAQEILWHGKLNERDDLDFPFYIALKTDKGITSNTIGQNAFIGGDTSRTIWNSRNAFTQGITDLVGIHSKVENTDTQLFKGTNYGGLNATPSYSNITVMKGNSILSKEVNGFTTYGSGRQTDDVKHDSSNIVDLKTRGHDPNKYDFHYVVKIPLSNLGISGSYIQQNGIGVQVVSTYSGDKSRGTDSLPYDMATKAEMQDFDSTIPSKYSSKLAMIGGSN
ncbi:hypothetical protein [Bifidobacterium dolichotidis]|uniref:hypothetical protein n=1 Tax=Bifidobacterium dolichotidis TaxID=2306976 RepID=UPI000F7E8466|nr:hypothetical protein [Bifidobacterium dolichotidis]